MTELEMLKQDLSCHKQSRKELKSGKGSHVKILKDANVHIPTLISHYDDIIKDIEKAIRKLKK